jgi:hypothetical protein
MEFFEDNEDKDLKIVSILRRLGDIDTTTIYDRRGKETKFIGKLKTTSEKQSELGILHYDWKRAVGVNKIYQAFKNSENAGLNGVIIVSNEFSYAAVEQASRINEQSSTKVVLIESSEIDPNFNDNFS